MYGGTVSMCHLKVVKYWLYVDWKVKHPSLEQSLKKKPVQNIVTKKKSVSHNGILNKKEPKKKKNPKKK